MIKWLVRRPGLALLLVAVVTGLAVVGGAQLEIRAQMEELFPESTPSLAAIKEVEGRLGFTSQIQLIFWSPDAQANRDFATALAARLQHHPQITRLELRRELDFFRRNGLLFLSVAELDELHGQLRERLRRAVARELGPFDSGEGEEEAGDGEPGLDEEFGDGEDEPGADAGLDEEFGEAVQPDAAATDSAEPDLTRPLRPPATAPAAASADFVPDEEEIRRRYGLQQLGEYYANRDGTIIGLKLFPAISPDSVAEAMVLMEEIEGEIAALDMSSYHPQMRFTVDGGYHRRINEMKSIRRDLANSSFVGGALIVFLVLAWFGSKRALLFVILPLAAGIGWTMGLAWLLIGHLNTITVFIVTILFGLGVDFAIHAVSRYAEERAAGQSPDRAVIVAVTRLSRPMISAAVTTSVTFLALSFLRFRGFSEFGLIAGFGVPLCLAAVVLVLPPLVVLMHRFFPERGGRLGARLGAVPWFAATRGRAAGAALITVAVGGALLAGLPRLYLDSDLTRVQTPREAYHQELCDRYQEEVESLSAIPIVALTGNLEESRRLHHHLLVNRERYPALQEVRSLHSFLPAQQAEKSAIIGQMRELLRKKRGALTGEDAKAADRALAWLSPEPFGPEGLPPLVRRPFTDKEGNLGHHLFLFADTVVTDSRDIGRVVKELGTLEVDGRHYQTAASYYVGWDMFDIVEQEGPVAMAVAALAVLLVLLIDFRRPLPVLLAFLPLPLGVGAFCGLSGLLDWPLNLFNMVILPTLFGIGVDTGIHLVYRGRERSAEGVVVAPGVAVGSTGAAAGMSALTTAAGFASIMLSQNPGLAGIGRMAPVGIFLCYLASIGMVGAGLWFLRRD